MKKKKLLFEIIALVIAPLGAYFGLYPTICIKPSQAGFWIIITLGLALGVGITRIAYETRQKKMEQIQAASDPE